MAPAFRQSRARRGAALAVIAAGSVSMLVIASRSSTKLSRV